MDTTTTTKCTSHSYYRGVLGLLVILFNAQKVESSSSIWTLWWNYEGISGPTMWGTMNTDWYMCSRGKNQSPIDIDPKVLLFDPTLKHIQIEGDLISGTLINNGVDLTFDYNQTKEHRPVNISLGPFSYKYTVSEIKLHFGIWDGEGSEHSVNGHLFDGEMQIVAYNSDVYHNLSHAKASPRGVAIIATFLQIGNSKNKEFDAISNISQVILFKGQRARLKNLSIVNMLPNIDNYITYEGSLTQPGCQETVTWVILNKPLTVTKGQLKALRNLRQRDPNHPRTLMGGNNRPVMPLNRRTVRTNINFRGGCSMAQDMQYQHLLEKDYDIFFEILEITRLAPPYKINRFVPKNLKIWFYAAFNNNSFSYIIACTRTCIKRQ